MAHFPPFKQSFSVNVGLRKFNFSRYWKVTAVSANHCPGAVQFLFKREDGERFIHCGGWLSSWGVSLLSTCLSCIFRQHILMRMLNFFFCHVSIHIFARMKADWGLLSTRWSRERRQQVICVTNVKCCQGAMCFEVTPNLILSSVQAQWNIVAIFLSPYFISTLKPE